MPEEIGFHPAAIAATTDVARAARDALDREVAADPATARSRYAGLVASPASPERDRIINRVMDRSYAAFTRRDWELNTMVMHPTTYVFESGGPERTVIDMPRRLQGAEGYIEGMTEFQDGWGEVVLRSEAVAGAGPSAYVNWVRFYMRGSGSGMTLEQPAAVLFTWDGDWLVLQQYWWDREGGTRAAGVDPATLESQL